MMRHGSAQVRISATPNNDESIQSLPESPERVNRDGMACSSDSITQHTIL